MTLAELSQDSQARWQQLFSSFPATHFLFILDKEGRYLDLRVPDPKRLWMSEAEHLGKTFGEVLPSELAKPRRYYFNALLESGKEQQYSYPHPLTEGRHMTCVLTLVGEEVLMRVFDSVVAEVPAANVLPDSDESQPTV